MRIRSAISFFNRLGRGAPAASVPTLGGVVAWQQDQLIDGQPAIVIFAHHPTEIIAGTGDPVSSWVSETSSDHGRLQLRSTPDDDPEQTASTIANGGKARFAIDIAQEGVWHLDLKGGSPIESASDDSVFWRLTDADGAEVAVVQGASGINGILADTWLDGETLGTLTVGRYYLELIVREPNVAVEKLVVRLAGASAATYLNSNEPTTESIKATTAISNPALQTLHALTQSMVTRATAESGEIGDVDLLDEIINYFDGESALPEEGWMLGTNLNLNSSTKQLNISATGPDFVPVSTGAKTHVGIGGIGSTDNLGGNDNLWGVESSGSFVDETPPETGAKTYLFAISGGGLSWWPPGFGQSGVGNVGFFVNGRRFFIQDNGSGLGDFDNQVGDDDFGVTKGEGIKLTWLIVRADGSITIRRATYASLALNGASMTVDGATYAAGAWPGNFGTEAFKTGNANQANHWYLKFDGDLDSKINALSFEIMKFINRASWSFVSTSDSNGAGQGATADSAHMQLLGSEIFAKGGTFLNLSIGGANYLNFREDSSYTDFVGAVSARPAQDANHLNSSVARWKNLQFRYFLAFETQNTAFFIGSDSGMSVQDGDDPLSADFDLFRAYYLHALNHLLDTHNANAVTPMQLITASGIPVNPEPAANLFQEAIIAYRKLYVDQGFTMADTYLAINSLDAAYPNPGTSDGNWAYHGVGGTEPHFADNQHLNDAGHLLFKNTTWPVVDTTITSAGGW